MHLASRATCTCRRRWPTRSRVDLIEGGRTGRLQSISSALQRDYEQMQRQQSGLQPGPGPHDAGEGKGRRRQVPRHRGPVDGRRGTRSGNSRTASDCTPGWPTPTVTPICARAWDGESSSTSGSSIPSAYASPYFTRRDRGVQTQPVPRVGPRPPPPWRPRSTSLRFPSWKPGGLQVLAGRQQLRDEPGGRAPTPTPGP